MATKITIVLVIGIILVISIYQFVIKANYDPLAEVEETYLELCDAIETKDLKKFSKLSHDIIWCPQLCADNTDEEKKRDRELRESNPELYWNEIYHAARHMPKEKFIEEDFDLIFDEYFKSRMKDKSYYSVHEFYSGDYTDYEVLIGMNSIDEPPLGIGQVYAIGFKKIGNKYKVTIIDSIP